MAAFFYWRVGEEETFKGPFRIQILGPDLMHANGLNKRLGGIY